MGFRAAAAEVSRDLAKPRERYRPTI